MFQCRLEINVENGFGGGLDWEVKNEMERLDSRRWDHFLGSRPQLGRVIGLGGIVKVGSGSG